MGLAREAGRIVTVTTPADHQIEQPLCQMGEMTFFAEFPRGRQLMVVRCMPAYENAIKALTTNEFGQIAAVCPMGIDLGDHFAGIFDSDLRVIISHNLVAHLAQ